MPVIPSGQARSLRLSTSSGQLTATYQGNLPGCKRMESGGA